MPSTNNNNYTTVKCLVNSNQEFDNEQQNGLKLVIVNCL